MMGQEQRNGATGPRTDPLRLNYSDDPRRRDASLMTNGGKWTGLGCGRRRQEKTQTDAF